MAAPRKIPPGKIIVWRQEDQRNALERGIFLERCKSNNRVVVVLARHSEFGSIPRALAHLERLAFNHDAFGFRAISFIVQQDRHQWSGAWDRSIESYHTFARFYTDHTFHERIKRQLAYARSRIGWAAAHPEQVARLEALDAHRKEVDARRRAPRRRLNGRWSTEALRAREREIAAEEAAVDRAETLRRARQGTTDAEGV